MSKVSILMPAYNAGKYICAAIRSVQAQTHTDWTLHILDDGSSDNTADICRHMLESDSRIRYYHQENQGLILGRQKLLTYVDGDFFMFMDSDDLLHPMALEMLLSVMSQDQSIEVVITEDVQRVSKRFAIGVDKTPIKLEKLSYRTMSGREMVSNSLGYPDNHPQYAAGLSGKLFRKGLSMLDFGSLPILFLGEDTCFSAVLFYHAARIAITNTKIYFYRSGGGSSRYYERLPKDIANLYAWRKNFISTYGLGERRLRSTAINVLDVFRAQAEGAAFDGKEVYRELKELILDAEKLGVSIPFAVHQECIEKIPVIKEPVVVRLKRAVLRYL